MFRRKHWERERAERVIVNLEAHAEELHAQLVAAAAEFDRRYAEMQRDRDYWREQAEGGKL